MKNLVLALLCIAQIGCSSVSKKGTCRDSNAYPNKIVKKIGIPTYSDDNSFYYVSKDYYVFIKPMDMYEYLKRFTRLKKNTNAYSLVERIRMDIELKNNKDLRAYNIGFWEFGVMLESLVIGLAKEGKVSIVSPGGGMVASITYVEHNESFADYSVVYAGEEGVNAMLYERYCIAD